MVDRELEAGETALLHLESTTYSSNLTGTHMWKGLKEGLTLRGISEFSDKDERISRGEFGELDHFLCWYCVKYLGKVPGSKNVMP